DVISLLQPKAQQKGLRLQLEIADDLPDILLGDRKRLGQVLLNLTDNALKFTDRGSVRICLGGHWRNDDEYLLVVSVHDDGIGLTEEQISRLFMPFVQAAGSTARRFGGTGLGLAICRELIELMGGQTGVESIPNGGSHFRFTLLCGRALSTTRSLADVDTVATDSPRLLGYSALLVEDDFISQQIGAALLDSLGMRVEIAASGEEALQRLAANSVDIILQDLQLPDMSGYEVTHRIRTELQLTEVPIIALTGFTLDEDRSRCLEAGFNDFVAKPYEFDVLKNTIRRLLGIREHIDAATDSTRPLAFIELPREELKKLLPRIETLLAGFDPDALALTQKLETLCRGTDLEYVAQRIRRDAELFDFANALQSLDILKTQFVVETFALTDFAIDGFAVGAGE